MLFHQTLPQKFTFQYDWFSTIAVSSGRVCGRLWITRKRRINIVVTSWCHVDWAASSMRTSDLLAWIPGVHARTHSASSAPISACIHLQESVYSVERNVKVVLKFGSNCARANDLKCTFRFQRFECLASKSLIYGVYIWISYWRRTRISVCARLVNKFITCRTVKAGDLEVVVDLLWP